MKLDRAGFALSLALVTLFHPAGAYAWGPDGVPVSVASDFQFSPVVAPDGEGGVFVAWIDRRVFPYQIYAQRLNTSGVPIWTIDGIPVCTAPGNSNKTPVIVADGQGGAIVAWTSSPTSGDRVFVQRLNAAGNRLWGPSGVIVCPTGGYQDYHRLVPDGSGGALIVWRDQRNEFAGDLYARRVNAAGALLWDTAGVAICVSAKDQFRPVVAAGGAGSAFVAWQDFRGPNFKIYAQLIDSSGAVQWTPNGVAVCSGPGEQSTPTIAEDGANGAVVAWTDGRGYPSLEICAQRLSHAGSALWDTSGVALGLSSYATDPCAVSDGVGGAVVAWEEVDGVRAQRVSASGALLYDSLGVRLTNSGAFGSDPRIVSDGVGGAIVTWKDLRMGSSNPDIYAQRVSAAGVLKWEAQGRAVCTAALTQDGPVIVPRGQGSAIIAWADFRSNVGFDIYAGCPDIAGDVSIGWEPPVTGRVGTLRPNPTRARAALNFELTTSQRVSIEVFDLSGRVVSRIVQGRTFAAGSHSVIWDGTSDRGDLAPAGIYGIRVSGSDFTVTRRVAVVR